MKHKLFITLLLITVFSCTDPKINCEIKTSEGSIFVELYPEKAPNTVSNFTQYILKDAYKNSSFFRVCTLENEATRDIKIEVIQGGDIPDELLFPPIDIETTAQTKINHKHGTISMARDTPNTAQSSFFICINDQPELDYKGKRHPDGQGFAAFGNVTKGMDVVLKIQSFKNKNQQLTAPVVIKSIKILE
ncbi:peptidylprolyl isomerase [Flavobacteriales bacterium 34_180_T64]|nr:peptidylprolyl isomerase [Flavobacteriales bacterium 34_180_T64]